MSLFHLDEETENQRCEVTYSGFSDKNRARSGFLAVLSTITHFHTYAKIADFFKSETLLKNELRLFQVNNTWFK